MIGDGKNCSSVLRGLRRQFFFILLKSLWVQPFCQHHFLQKDDCTHGVIESQFMLVKLRQYGTDIQMRICLDLGSLQPRFNRESPLQEVERCTHFSNTAIVASHVVEGHRLTKFIVLAQFFAFLQKVKCTVNILLLEVVDCKDVADLTQLFACARELSRCCAKMHFFDL